MSNPYQVTLPCGWSAIVPDEPGSLLHDLTHSLDGSDFYAEEFNKLLLCLCGTQGRTLLLTSQYFVQRFRQSLKDILRANSLTLKHERGFKPLFNAGGF